jgi:hypothetical protein
MFQLDSVIELTALSRSGLARKVPGALQPWVELALGEGGALEGVDG